MNGHVILLGDSIFDNASYVADGQSVIEHLRRIVPSGWEATLVAVDGATISSVERQLDRIPDSATHLVLSVGGNDVIGLSGMILSNRTDSYSAALTGIASMRDDFTQEYRHMLDRVKALRLPLAVCTIYDSVPDLGSDGSVGLAIFNDVITKQVFSVGATLVDLRLTCNEPTDYAAMSPIEPSATGGEKIARAICRSLLEPESGCRVIA